MVNSHKYLTNKNPLNISPIRGPERVLCVIEVIQASEIIPDFISSYLPQMGMLLRNECEANVHRDIRQTVQVGILLPSQEMNNTY